MNQKQILYTTIGLVVLFGGLFGIYKLLGTGPDESLIAKVKIEKPPQRTIWNKTGASHTLTVFSDFQCPACKLFDEYLAGFTASASPNLSITKKTALVFRYFPLYQIHEHAFPLAYAAEAAARQGKFAKISARFFADQTSLEGVKDLSPYLSKVAKDLKLDEKKFVTDMNDKTVQDVIQSDLSLGESLGVNSTPTFYLDGEKLENVAPLDLLNLLKKLN